MRRLRLALGLGAAASVCAVLVGLAQGWWETGGSAPPPSQPLAVTTSLSPQALAFGDPLGAHADLLLDPRSVDPSSIRVAPRFAPFRIRGSHVDVSSAKGAVLLSYRFALECLSAGCVPERQQVEKRFLPLVVSYRTRAGSRRTLDVDWPSFRLSSHLSDADRAAPGQRMRANAPLPPVSYRVDPAALRTGLAAGAGALALLASALAWLALRRRPERRAEPEPEPDPLVRALLLVRASTTNGFPAERRMALGRLARELRDSGRTDLAQAAGRLAWSAESPSADAAGAFADRLERVLEDA